MPGIMLKLFPMIHVLLNRLTGGRFGSDMRGFKVLLLTIVGRKSGKPRTNPLGYFEHNGGYVIIGSNLGFDTHPAWFLNLKRNPRVTLQVRDNQMTAQAEVVSPELSQPLWARLLTIAPGYADYQKRTAREIPLVLLRQVT